MTYALITITFLLAAQTVRCWIWRRLAKRARKLNAELLEQNADQLKVLEGARTIAKIAAKGMREQEEEWPSLIK